MKKLLLSAAFALVLLASPVAAAHYWKVDISTPKSLINQKTFNVEYVSSSTDASDKITVELFQNGVSRGSQTTDAPYGDSGAFNVTVPGDGTYQYFMKTNSSIDGAGPDTATKTVTVDTVAPSTPIYTSKTRDGNTYTLTFTVPENGDVAEIRIYASSSQTFTADASTQVGLLNVSPGETRTFSYTAPDSSERFFALQTFDQAGNFSPLVADQNATVAQGQPAATGVTAANAAGEVGGTGAATATNPNENTGTNQGQVLGEQTNEGGSGNWIWIALAIIAVAALYYMLMIRPRRRISDK